VGTAELTRAAGQDGRDGLDGDRAPQAARVVDRQGGPALGVARTGDEEDRDEEVEVEPYADAVLEVGRSLSRAWRDLADSPPHQSVGGGAFQVESRLPDR